MQDVYFLYPFLLLVKDGETHSFVDAIVNQLAFRGQTDHAAVVHIECLLPTLILIRYALGILVLAAQIPCRVVNDVCHRSVIMDNKKIVAGIPQYFNICPLAAVIAYIMGICYKSNGAVLLRSALEPPITSSSTSVRSVRKEGILPAAFR